MLYSIIIPVFNESTNLKTLLSQLESFYKKGHEIIIINDGSTDDTKNILNDTKFIKAINLGNNSGKGIAIKHGLLNAVNSKIIIYDGDLELDTEDISKLMILNKKQNIFSIMGIRFKSLGFLNSGIDWGNFMFTSFFNIINKTLHKDILCCAKSFYIKDIPINKLMAKGFDIDVELASILTKNNRGKPIPQKMLNYNRRGKKDGKKLKISDGWIILKRVMINF